MGDRLPRYAPMLASSGWLPADDDEWAFEMKWDDNHAIIYAGDGPLRMISRNDKDFTVAYPELRKRLAGLDLDGERWAVPQAFRSNGAQAFRASPMGRIDPVDVRDAVIRYTAATSGS